MSNIIINKRSTTPAAVPQTTQLQAGEFAINAADGKIFVKTTADEIVNLLDYTFADGGLVLSPGPIPTSYFTPYTEQLVSGTTYRPDVDLTAMPQRGFTGSGTAEDPYFKADAYNEINNVNLKANFTGTVFITSTAWVAETLPYLLDISTVIGFIRLTVLNVQFEPYLNRTVRIPGDYFLTLNLYGIRLSNLRIWLVPDQPLITITQQPFDSNFAMSNHPAFVIANVTQHRTINYQWQTSDDETDIWIDIVGATTDTLTREEILGNSVWLPRAFRCVLTADGAETVITRAAQTELFPPNYFYEPGGSWNNAGWNIFPGGSDPMLLGGHGGVDKKYISASITDGQAPYMTIRARFGGVVHITADRVASDVYWRLDKYSQFEPDITLVFVGDYNGYDAPDFSIDFPVFPGDTIAFGAAQGASFNGTDFGSFNYAGIFVYYENLQVWWTPS